MVLIRWNNSSIHSENRTKFKIFHEFKNSKCTVTSIYILDKSRATSMAAVVYRATLNSKHDLSAPSIPLRVRHCGSKQAPPLRLLATLDSWEGQCLN